MTGRRWAVAAAAWLAWATALAAQGWANSDMAALFAVDRSICGPNTICNGESAAPIARCIFVDGSCGDRSGIVAAWLDRMEARGVADADIETTPKFPEVVALLSNTYRVLCTGIAIGPDRVLTAAHCLDAGVAHVFFGSRIDRPPTRGAEPLHDGWIFPAGPAGRLCNPETGQCESSHSGHLLDLGLVWFDAGVREIDPYFWWSPDDEAARGPDGFPPRYLDVWGIAGFGSSELDRSGGEKRYAFLEGAGCGDDCTHWETITLEDANGVDVCEGDSGGPLFAFGFLAGITRGSLEAGGTDGSCGKGGVYTHLYNQWVVDDPDMAAAWWDGFQHDWENWTRTYFYLAEMFPMGWLRLELVR